jgi:hypothetical protein
MVQADPMGLPARPLDDGVAAPAQDRGLAVATTLAHWLDRRFLDPLIGLVLPGVGDVIGAVLGLYAVFLAWRMRAPKVLIARMLMNLSLDLLGGLVPVVGDVWDFFFKANTRNLELLRARSGAGEPRSTPGDWLLVVCAALLFLVALATPFLLVGLLVKSLGSLLVPIAG